uniref:Transmembrane protein 254 n=1 Tax=Branchiostoma floridae TaxID=7739 RepID=C3ZJ04_BRAFL|eukprot:XP_002591509.1 hypothetical protein BRAFLDRAFT_105275 [Branchiostoma floridae]
MAATKENFKRLPIWMMGFVFVFFALVGLAVLAPDSTPWHVLGPVGSFIQNTIKNDPARIQEMQVNTKRRLRSIQDGGDEGKFPACPSLGGGGRFCPVSAARGTHVVVYSQLAVFAPDTTPWYVFGPVGSFIQDNIKNDRIQEMQLGILGIHVAETVIAFFVTLWKDISGPARLKWLLQTFVFGIFSLVPLFMFKPAVEKKVK